MHEDNTLKPSYTALQNLIHGAWETHETLHTDADGHLTLTGFKGSYTLTTAQCKTNVTLSDSKDETVTVCVG